MGRKELLLSVLDKKRMSKETVEGRRDRGRERDFDKVSVTRSGKLITTSAGISKKTNLGERSGSST